MGPSATRRVLPLGLKNSTGALVWVGDNEFNIYCGAVFAKPQTLHRADGSLPVQWDGRCGPRKGPQCDACRWLENRKPAHSAANAASTTVKRGFFPMAAAAVASVLPGM